MEIFLQSMIIKHVKAVLIPIGNKTNLIAMLPQRLQDRICCCIFLKYLVTLYKLLELSFESIITLLSAFPCQLIDAIVDVFPNPEVKKFYESSSKLSLAEFDIMFVNKLRDVQLPALYECPS